MRKIGKSKIFIFFYIQIASWQLLIVIISSRKITYSSLSVSESNLKRIFCSIPISFIQSWFLTVPFFHSLTKQCRPPPFISLGEYQLTIQIAVNGFNGKPKIIHGNIFGCVNPAEKFLRLFFIDLNKLDCPKFFIENAQINW